MNALDYILDGLEAELALERELGVRTVELDRSLLVASAVKSPPAAPARQRPPAPAEADRRAVRPSGAFDFVFLHHAAFSPRGVEMMAKIIPAMGRTAETAPIVIAPPLPQAKVYVVMGGLALKMFFPGMKAEPGSWQKSESGADVLVTYSPEFILRFRKMTPELEKIKHAMWRSLKVVLQKV